MVSLMNTMFEKDISFVIEMAQKYKDFNMTSWYWRPVGMSLESYIDARRKLTQERGCYEGMGLINSSSYHFKIYESDLRTACISFTQGKHESRDMTVPVEDLFIRLHDFIAQQASMRSSLKI